MSGRVVLHLGAHKTGTSVIQRYIRDRPDLMVGNKIGFVLRSETDDLIGWGGRALDTGMSRLRQRIEETFKEGATHFVVSHENTLGRPFVKDKVGLYPRRDEILPKLAKGLSDLPLTLLYYIRKQEDFLESYYLQSLHEGGSKTFDRWKAEVDVKALSWRPVIESLRTCFGPGNVVVKDFSTEMAEGQQNFLRRAFTSFYEGLQPDQFENFQYAPLRNISIGDKGLRIALAINPFAETADERTRIRHFLQKNFSNQMYPRPLLLSPSEKEAISRLYEQENAELCA